jgi:glucosamine-6-phosphate deaminase
LRDPIGETAFADFASRCRKGAAQGGKMRIYREQNYDTMSERAAQIIGALVLQKPGCVLGLATGSTPIGTYQRLIDAYEKRILDFSKVKTVNLDEYRGLDGTNKESYRYYMNHNLFDHINIDKANTHVPDGMAADGAAAGRAYDEMMAELGGTDLQLLGLGQNGHIGFNEPGQFIAGTHVVKLTESTIKANSRLFDDISQVPREAITMGMRGIMTSREILLIANGPKKAKALEAALYGPITSDVPASILQLHPNLIVVCDEEALPQMR